MSTQSNVAEKITRRAYKNSKITLPLLGFGMMRLPQNNGVIDGEEVQKMVDSAMDCGCNYFDTAYVYHNGLSEGAVAEALKKYRREDYFLADKMPMWMLEKTEQMEEIFQEQLSRCQCGYFDFYLMHALEKGVWERSKILKVYEFLDAKKAEGKIRYLGFSFHDTPEVLREIVEQKKWDFAQIQLNFLDWEIYRSREQYEILTRADIPVIVMEPLRGGSLATLTPKACEMLIAAEPERSVPSWGLRYVASLPNVLTVLSGMSIPAQLVDNLKTFTNFTPLSIAENETLLQALEVYKQTLAIPCTACHYCMPCPAGV
ncbi:MAG: aldo/keto reductase, partial [Victivallaceae bacterium]